ncbi:MAG: cytochrome P450 [Marmoricola sp.]
MGPISQVRQAGGFAARLYGERVRGELDAYVRRDLFTRLRHRPGRDDPYPIYEQIRSQGPFISTRLGNLASPDHGVCRDVLRSRRFGVQPERAQHVDDDFDLSFLDRNPPDHTRLRRLAAPAFSPRRVAGYRVTIEKTVDELLAAAPGEFDLVTRLAAPLPIAVITDLLGIPDADAEAFSRYGRVIGSALGGVQSLRHVRALMAANADIERIFRDLFALRCREPRDDLISELVAAEGDQISPAEMVPLCSLLLIAGFETTVNLVGNAVNALLEHPDQWQLLREDPTLAGAATVETLRFDPPVQRTARFSFDDCEITGQPVREGQVVHVLLGGANRDPAVFDRPAEFDITRPDAGEHLAFSSGIHHCLGRPLAELEATVALQRLAEAMPRLRRAGALRRRNATLIRGPVSLPVSQGK